MFKDQFYIHKEVLYQGIELDDESISIPTLVLDEQGYLYGLLDIVALLLEIYERAPRIKFLRVEISVYSLEIDDDIILIYPSGVNKELQESFLEIIKEDLFELYNLLVSQICDNK